MANEQTSGVLAAALNQKVISDAFEIARKAKTGILQVANMGQAKRPTEGYKQSWLDMQVGASSSTLAAAVADGVATTITVADGSVYRAGMLVSTDATDEVMKVSSVSGNTLTVVRGVGGTTGAAIPDGTELFIDSVGRKENSLAENDGIFQPTSVENFFQTLDTAVEMSRRALATLQFGNTNDLTFQVSERIRQLAIQMDRMLVRGRKFTDGNGADMITYSGGLRYYTDQAGANKVDHGGAALTLDAINAVNKEIIARGGNSNTIAVGLDKAQELSALVRANYNSQRLGDWTADEGSLLTLPSDLPLVGNVNRIVVDTNLAGNELMIFDSGMLSIIPMASGNAQSDGNWETKDATAKGQDGERVRILGDFSVEMRNSKTHFARMHNIG